MTGRKGGRPPPPAAPPPDLPTERRRRVVGPAPGPNVAANPAALVERVKTAHKRTASSTRWLERQLNDPYVKRAKAEGYRSRAAYKLVELDARHGILRQGARVADLGAAPGGWLQVAQARGAGRIVGVDLLPIEPLPGVTLIEGDFTEAEIQAQVLAALGGRADLVLSDMAANTVGHRGTDHIRVVALVEAAAAFARDNLAPGGVFVAKVFQGGAEGALLADLKRVFTDVRHAKPPASRDESPETYLVAKGYRG